MKDVNYYDNLKNGQRRNYWQMHNWQCCLPPGLSILTTQQAMNSKNKKKRK